MLFSGLSFILFSSLIIIFYSLYHVSHYFYNSKKFKTYIDVIMSVSTLILAVGVLFQVIAFQVEQHKQAVQSYTEYSKDFTSYIIEIFRQNPEMNYYYENLFNNKPIPPGQQRNYILEEQLSMNIFVKTVEPIAIIKQFSDNPDIKQIKTAFVSILGKFFKSSTFTNYYKNNYKPTFSNPVVIDFMHENFGV
jgi:tryptophan-rich sensory protein